MRTTVPSVLLLEDDAADALLIERAISRSLPAATVTWAANRQEYLTLLQAGAVDVVVSDGSVPGCEGIESFYLARHHDRTVPFLFISGSARHPDPTGVRDLRALRALGVADLLCKDDLTQVGHAVGQVLTGIEPWSDRARLLAGQELVLVTTRELLTALDLPALTAVAEAAARRLTGSDRAILTVCASDDPSPPFPLGECLSGWTVQHRQPAVVDDAGADLRVPPAMRDPAVRSAVTVPVRAAEPIGTLGTYWTDRHEADATEVRLLQALADSIAVGLENLRLRRHLESVATSRSDELAHLMYAVSHDLRAPIRHLEGFSRILLEDATDLSPESRHGVQRIQDAAIQLREMVTGMLTLSRIGQTEVHRQPVDLAQLGRDVALGLNAPAPATTPARAGAVEFIVAEQLLVSGDPRLLLIAVTELLGNAWKFTSRVQHPRVELGVLDPAPEGASSPVYFVRDNGAGFGSTSADRLFGLFQRLHGADEFPGLGVGLAAVKRVVDLHSGTLWATGAPDAGATFCFTLG